MAEEEKDEAKPEGEGTGGGASNKKLFIIIGGVVLLILVIAIPTIFFLTRKKGPEIETLPAGAALKLDEELLFDPSYQDEEMGEDEEPLGAIFPLETFIVNLAGGKFIKTQIQVEFEGRDVPRRFISKLIPIRDGLIILLSNRSERDISNEQGKESLKDDIIQLINETLRKEEVKKIYFTEFVIQ